MKQKFQNIIRKYNYIFEFIILAGFTLAFDVILTSRFDVSISRLYIIVTIASASLLVGALVIIKGNKTRFGFYMAYMAIQIGLFIADSCLYYFKTDLISLAMLLEIGNALAIGLRYNIFVTFSFLSWVLMLLMSVGVGFMLYYLCYKTENSQKFQTKRVGFVVVSLILLMLGSGLISENDKTLYKTPEDKKAFFQTFGLVTFHQRDAISIAKRIFIDPFQKDDLLEVVKERFESPTTITTPQTGLFEGKNVIMIMCETCEMYAYDEELTPNYYYLMNNSFNFHNTFSAAKLNYTYDSEFKSLVSQMYFKTDNYMYTLSDHTFSSSLPSVLKQNGYTANAFHSYFGGFFNRDNIYQGMGFDQYYTSDDMTFSDHDYWALDSEMFEQMIELIAPVQDQPFFSYIITLTGHGPHSVRRTELEEYYQLIDENENLKDRELSFKTLMAAQMDFDKGLGLLIHRLNETNLLDETVIVISSDHKNYSSFDMTLKYKELSDSPLYINQIPYLIFSKDLERTDIYKYTSQYDMTPTILDLLGIKYYQEYYYGESIFKEGTQKPLIFSYTSWITNSMFVFENKIYWYDENQIDDPQAYQVEITNYIYQEATLSETLLLADYLKDVISYQN